MRAVCIVIVLILSVEAKIQIIITDAPLVAIGSKLFKKYLLTNNFQSPKELAYDDISKNIYFMYMDDELQNSGRAFINTVTEESGKIEGIKNNKATAVGTNANVYFGSENGLYKYDPELNKAELISLYNINILKLVIRKGEMFIIDAENHEIYEVFEEGEKVVKVGDWQTVMEFDVDYDRNIHFVTTTGVYCAISGHETVKNKDLSIVYHFIVDGEKTYGINDNGMFILNCKNGTADYIARLDFTPRSIIFGEYGDIYYAIDDNIFKLKPVDSFVLYNIHKNSKNNTTNA